jgi:hypothetical protein
LDPALRVTVGSFRVGHANCRSSGHYNRNNHLFSIVHVDLLSVSGLSFSTLGDPTAKI